MRLVTLIRDGQGHLLLAATGAPDLTRRTVAAQTGAADLLWCAVPPQGLSARTIVAQAEARVGRTVDGHLATTVERALATLTRLTVTEPLRAERRRRLRRHFRDLHRGMAWLLPSRRPAVATNQ